MEMQMQNFQDWMLKVRLVNFMLLKITISNLI